MKINEILSANLIDLIFDGRNKDYGAYDLRNTYERRIKKALLITLCFALLSIGGVALANSFKGKNVVQTRGPEVTLTIIDETPPKEEPKPELPPEQPEQPVETRHFAEPVIVPEDEFDKPLPDIASLDSARVGLANIEGKKDSIDIIDPPDAPPVGDPKGVLDIPQTPKEPETTVDVAAKFTGNWKRFLETNLNAETPVNNGASAGRYSVVIQFVVDLNGAMSEVNALTNHGYGMEQEAVRVIKKAPKWQPAVKAGYNVKAFHKQVIVFEVVE